MDTGLAKHSRAETCSESTDEEMLDPDTDKPEPDSPGPPRVPSLHSSQPLPSTSSTQRAMVNAFASQRDLPRATSGPNFRPTPIPQTQGSFMRFVPRPRSPSPDPCPPSHKHHSPSLNPRPASPDLRPFSPDPHPLSPDPRPSSPEPPRTNINPWADPRPYDTSPTPELHRARPALSARSVMPSASGRRPMPDPNSVTELETESEPQLKPKPARRRHQHLKRKTPTCNKSPELAPQPSDQHVQHPVGERDALGTPSTRHHDAFNMLMRLNKLLDDDAGPNNKEIDLLLHQAGDLAPQRQPSQHSLSLRAQPGSLSSRAQPGPSSSRMRPRPPPPHARPSPTPDHDYRRPVRDANSSGHNSEGEAGTREETDVEATNTDDPIVLERFGLSRYPGTRGRVASRAIRLLLSTAVRKGVYQSHDTYG
ncbi:hypothetical protein FRC06_005702, partial [Ceratobasidium sp. 370]